MCKENRMYLRQVPEDKTVIRKFVPSTVPLQWVNRDSAGHPRNPTPTKEVYQLENGFVAAGKSYKSLQQLGATETDTPGLYLDIYGREVLPFCERFPCFDSYDYLYEDRYFRWFYIYDGSKLTEIYCEDERPHVEVINDIPEVPRKWWDTISETWGPKD